MLDPCLLLESVTLWSLRHVATDSLWDRQRISESLTSTAPWTPRSAESFGLVESCGNIRKTNEKWIEKEEKYTNMRNDRNTLYITKLPQKPEKDRKGLKLLKHLNYVELMQLSNAGAFLWGPQPWRDQLSSTGCVSKISEGKHWGSGWALLQWTSLAAIKISGSRPSHMFHIVSLSSWCLHAPVRVGLHRAGLEFDWSTSEESSASEKIEKCEKSVRLFEIILPTVLPQGQGTAPRHSWLPLPRIRIGDCVSLSLCLKNIGSHPQLILIIKF